MHPGRDGVQRRHPSRTGHGIQPVRNGRPSAGGRPAGSENPVIGWPPRSARKRDGKELRRMATQINVWQADTLGILPSALVVLMTILAILGVIANVATA